MKTPYLKVIYAHLSCTRQRIIYVASDGTETDISNVIESAEITVACGDIARCILKAPLVVTQTEVDEV